MKIQIKFQHHNTLSPELAPLLHTSHSLYSNKLINTLTVGAGRNCTLVFVNFSALEASIKKNLEDSKIHPTCEVWTIFGLVKSKHCFIWKSSKLCKVRVLWNPQYLLLKMGTKLFFELWVGWERGECNSLSIL